MHGADGFSQCNIHSAYSQAGASACRGGAPSPDQYTCERQRLSKFFFKKVLKIC